MRNTRARSLASSVQDFDGAQHDLLPDLVTFLDADPRPTLVVPVSPQNPIEFGISFSNAAFHDEQLDEQVQQRSNAAGQFRAWCLAAHYWRGKYEFAGRVWTAFKIQGTWKCIQGSAVESKNGPNSGTTRNTHRATPSDSMRAWEKVEVADARLASIHRMMEMSDVGTFEYTPQGTLIRANESWYRLSLHPRKEDMHTDFSFMDLVYPPDGPLVLSKWNTLALGIPVTFEMRWKGRQYNESRVGDGNENTQWVLSACVPILDNDGNLVSIAGNTIDINAQKRVQEEAVQRAEALERARESEHKFAKFAMLTPVAIAVLDSDAKITYCNSRWFDFTGHPLVDDFQTIDWSSLIYPDDQNDVNKHWEDLVVRKQHSQVHFRLKRTWDLGDGTLRQRWVESQAYPELDDHGNVVRIFSAMIDVSRFKWAEQVQKSRMEEALEAKRKHENFIDMTSHEMRNPLSAVIQCADSSIESLKTILALNGNPVSSDADRATHIDNEIKSCLDSLQTIIACSIHQKRVIDDVLTLSKMDSNLLAVTPIRAKPATIVADAVHMFEPECDKDNIQLEFTEDPSLENTRASHVMMDPSRVLQVLINLLTNAIKFTRGQPIRRIDVTLGACRDKPIGGPHQIPYADISTDAAGLLDGEEWGGGNKVYIWMECKDTGCGMSTREQANLFTRFSQASPRTHIRYGGSGLGLFISKKLTELQGGAIGVQSVPDVGSKFGFFIATRIAETPSPPRSAMGRDSPFTRTVSPRGSPSTQSQYSVLVVEDNLVNQKVLSQQLRKVGFTVHVANHGLEAIEFLRKTEHWSSHGSTEERIPLSIILMDVEMPVMDGLSCTRKIREYEQSGEIVGHVPIMAVSANARSEQVMEALEVGVDDTISKPFRIPELIPKIEVLVAGAAETFPPPTNHSALPLPLS